MANDWSGVDKPEYIPDTETDAGDYIRMDYDALNACIKALRIRLKGNNECSDETCKKLLHEREKKLIKKAKEILFNGRDSGD